MMDLLTPFDTSNQLKENIPGGLIAQASAQPKDGV
jgi:hypothetical protein